MKAYQALGIFVLALLVIFLTWLVVQDVTTAAPSLPPEIGNKNSN